MPNSMKPSPLLPDDSWDGELGEIYPRVVDPVYGRVDHVIAVHSLNPRSMRAHLALSPSPGSPTDPQPAAGRAGYRSRRPWPARILGVYLSMRASRVLACLAPEMCRLYSRRRPGVSASNAALSAGS